MHRNLTLLLRSACMSRKNGEGTMIRKACWGVLASIFLALSFMTGCGTTAATVTPAAVTTVTANTPFVQNTTLNTAFSSPLSATVTTNGTPVVGQTVTFSAPGAGAGGTFPNGTGSANGTTDANGLATSPTFTANGTVGTYNVIASAAATQSTALFNLSNTLTPTMITATAGSGQSQTVDKEFGTALAVTVVDASGAPVSGLPVTFTAPASGVSGYFIDTDSNTTTATTNGKGVATAAIFVAGSTAGGPYTVTGSFTTGTPPVTTTTNFSLTNNP
jgi:hypothetical protein